jgi:hypothetical protein
MTTGFPYDGPEDFYASIGKFAISWAYVEFGLDWLIRHVLHQLDGSKHVEPDMPASLQRKLKYLRKAFRTLPRLATFKDRFEKMADKIRDASDERHDLIHGFIVSQEGEKAVMARIVPGTEMPKLFPVTSVSFLRAAVRADEIQVMIFAAEVSEVLLK